MTATRPRYLLKVHRLYKAAADDLKLIVKGLRDKLSDEEFRNHPDVKFAARLRRATLEVIPDNPNLPEYRLKGPLKKYRRYKQGLQRYRLFFSFSSSPPIIVYLYINDRNTLRKDGSKSDPYYIFTRMVERGEVSADPSDPRLLDWIQRHQ